MSAHKGQCVTIRKIKITTNGNRNLSLELIHMQFPTHLAYSMTINKSQGQSLRFAGVNLVEKVFSHGQPYVGLPRATCCWCEGVNAGYSYTEGWCVSECCVYGGVWRLIGLFVPHVRKYPSYRFHYFDLYLVSLYIHFPFRCFVILLEHVIGLEFKLSLDRKSVV